MSPSRRRHFAYGARKEAGRLGIQVSAGRTRASVGPGPRVGERVGAVGRWVEPNNNTKWGDTAKACVDLALISSPAPRPQ
jgi:hypothetical protein